MNRINSEVVTKLITNNNHYFFGTSRNILLGAGLCFAIENKKYWEVPVVFIFPSIYIGYQSFKNRDIIIQNIKRYNNMIPLSRSTEV
jgi:hypothetical protein